MFASVYRRFFFVIPMLAITLLISACGAPPATSNSGQIAGETGSPATAPTDATTETAAAETGGPEPAETGSAEPAKTGSPVASAAATEEAFDPTGAGLVVYSGRNKNLVGPLIEKFEAATGMDVAVRYGDTAELAATILEEGGNTPADVFFSQDAGALGALTQANVLAPLPGNVLNRVDARFRASGGQWVGLSGRARVVIYNTDKLKAEDLPQSIRDFTDPRWNGKIGWAPTNASFQAFVTAFRRLEGDDKALAWLQAIKANGAKSYKNNTAVVEAVAAGEVEAGFVNHYYLLNIKKQKGDDFAAANYFFPGADIGSLINVAGAGILNASDNKPAAEQFVQYLLSEEAQSYFATETFEYPLVEGVAADSRLPALRDVQTPQIDLSDLSDLEGTLDLLREADIL